MELNLAFRLLFPLLGAKASRHGALEQRFRFLAARRCRKDLRKPAQDEQFVLQLGLGGSTCSFSQASCSYGVHPLDPAATVIAGN